MGRAIPGMRRSTKLEFLRRVAARTRSGDHGPSPLMTSDDYARDHVQMICESLQLGLTRLYRDPEGYGYEIRITQAGRCLAAGRIEAAATMIDSDTGRSRLAGDPPEGVLGTVLAPGSVGLSLHGMAARQNAPEMMRGVATGYLVVVDGAIHAAPGTGRMQGGKRTGDKRTGDKGGRAFGWARETIPALPSSRAARHVGAGRS